MEDEALVAPHIEEYCCECGKPLRSGEDYIKELNYYCREDYQRQASEAPSSPWLTEYMAHKEFYRRYPQPIDIYDVRDMD